LQLTDIGRTVYDFQIAILIQNAGVAGMEVASAVYHFCRRVWPFVIASQHRCGFHQHFPIVGQPQINAGCGAAYAVKLDFSIRLQADIGAGFG
jgi:hypothetical protein